MKPVKFILLGCAALATLIVFAVPYLDLGHGIDFTLWKLRDVNPSESLIHPYVILIAMIAPVAFGALALRSQRLPRWQSIVSVLCFGIALLIAMTVFSKTETTFGDHGALGAKLMIAALLGGAAAAIAGIVRPERA
jgi:hypothetical protein